jgi:hypothetical protein
VLEKRRRYCVAYHNGRGIKGLRGKKSDGIAGGLHEQGVGMNKEKLRHAAFMALVDLLNAFDVARAELTAEKISPQKIIWALDYFESELKDARKTFEELVE